MDSGRSADRNQPEAVTAAARSAAEAADCGNWSNSRCFPLWAVIVRGDLFKHERIIWTHVDADSSLKKWSRAFLVETQGVKDNSL